MSRRSPLPKPGTGQALTTWIPTETFPQLDKLAAQRGISRSTVARQIILNFLNTLNGESPAA